MGKLFYILYDCGVDQCYLITPLTPCMHVWIFVQFVQPDSWCFPAVLL